MSEVSRECAGDPDEEPNDSSSDDSCITSAITTKTTAATANTTINANTTTTHIGDRSTDSRTSRSGSDNGDDDGVNNTPTHRHKPRQKSKGHPRGDSTEPDTSNPPGVVESDDDKEIDGLQTKDGQKCDIMTNCPSTDESPVGQARNDRQEKDDEQHRGSHPINETKSPPQLKKPPPQTQTESGTHHRHDTQCHSVSNPDEPVVVSPAASRRDRHIRYNLSTNTTSLGSSYSNLSSTNSTFEPTTLSETQPRRTLRPDPSPSPSLSIIDTNNNKDTNSSSSSNNNSPSSRDALSSIKRTNFSKSASGSRLINRSRPNVCDCLTQDCAEKKHSNRRQFIEHYYNSRTQLPSSSANTSTSSFNISTPLNRLYECDAITRRLLSSPIRTNYMTESPTHRAQVTDVDRSRRASLGTNTMTDQVFLFSSNPFKSLELSHRKNRNDSNKIADSQPNFDLESGCHSSVKNDTVVKQQQQQQQQGRSLSVCDEETLNPRLWSTGPNHSPNLNRTVSLACETDSSSTARRLLTIIPLFGCDIKSLEQFSKLGLILPPVIDSAIEHILVNGINSIGIFRKSGVKSRIMNLKQRIESNQSVRFDEINQNNEFSIYDIADLVKMWFRELKPVPLMTKELIKVISAFINTTSTHKQPQISAVKYGNTSQQESLISRSSVVSVGQIDPSVRKKIESTITPSHRFLLLRALNFLAQISSKCETNQMTSQNLAICLTPSLCATDSDQHSILVAQKALEYSIDNHKKLFG